MKAYEDMTRKEAKAHLDGGGTFALPPEYAGPTAMGGTGRVGRTFEEGSYLVVMDMSPHGKSVQGAADFSQIEQFMLQWGPIEFWVAASEEAGEGGEESGG